MHPKVHGLCWSCDFLNFEYGSEMENCHSFGSLVIFSFGQLSRFGELDTETKLQWWQKF
jgi:hypothetical protein